MAKNSLQIKDFIANEWSLYADYDNRRSIPHVMDGLKITQRKAMFTALDLPKNTAPLKVSQFASKAAEATAYHHGESSMITTIVGLAQDYPGSNNYPWLEKHGQFGTRLSKTAAAPRYIHTRLSDNWNTFFKKEDQEIVETLVEEGQEIEPKYYIPVLPTILLNGAEGVGNGYKSVILNYKSQDVAKACREILKGGKIRTPLVPYINGWTGKIEKVGRQVIFTGELKVIHSTKLEIRELPPGYDNESYKAHLNDLIEKDVIKDYENHSTEDKWLWIIEVPRTTSAKGHTALLGILDLVEKTTENFVCWGMDASAPVTFESPEALVEYWYAERIKLYVKSIANQIKNARADIVRADLKMRFIKWCLKNDFRKLTRKEFIDNSVAGVKGLGTELASEFTGIPMYRITTDEVEKLAAEIDKLMDYLEELEALTPDILMERNLKGL